jgi:hypothetical protein
MTLQALESAVARDRLRQPLGPRCDDFYKVTFDGSAQFEVGQPGLRENCVKSNDSKGYLLCECLGGIIPQ